MADRGRPLAAQDAAPRDVGDHQVLRLDLFEADALGLGVAHAVLVAGMGHADHHAADARIDQPARRQAMGIGDVAFSHLGIELDVGIGRELVDLERDGRGSIHG
jgi:hypothetical protein